MLTPSGDLPHTEAVLKSTLKSLPAGWVHANVAPPEERFADMLSHESLFLYFGHGSGNQFIRTRTVRKLERAPTTWLMGCSSGAVTDNGGFEPSGMILAYLTAGAPAVVGTLWDVTDKDCDRATLRAGVEWGLWQSGETHKSLVIKGKGKTRRQGGGVVEIEEPRGSRAAGKRPAGRDGCQRRQSDAGAAQHKSLVEAVRIARSECYLRYLNGAALVVYGIPVLLND
jgi:separase